MSKATHTNHSWNLAEDQSDTGTMGVRIICNPGKFQTHYLTVHRDLLEKYL